MIDWILRHLGVLIFVVIFVSQIVRGALRARAQKAEHEAQHDETAEQRRVREIQERIRRQVSERRSGRPVPEAPPPVMPRRAEAPVPRPHTTQLPEPFGGPLGRMLEDLQRRTQQPPPAPPPPRAIPAPSHVAELERQQQLADQLANLRDERATIARRAGHVAADKAEIARSEPALRTVARGQLLQDLSDPQSLRRAFVLREVLGPPVALR